MLRKKSTNKSAAIMAALLLVLFLVVRSILQFGQAVVPAY